MKWGDEGGDDVDSQDKDHDDHDDDEGRDASSNGGWRRRQKRTFASPLNSTGDNGIMIYLSCQNINSHFLTRGRVFEKGYHSLTIEEERKIVQVDSN